MRNKLFTLSLGLILLAGLWQCATKKVATRSYRYEIECVGTGVQGTYLIKVWTYSQDSKVAVAEAKKNAVHAVIFKGFAGSGQGCTSQKPLASADAEEKNKDFFQKFFSDGGDFNKYVAATNDGAINSGDRLKVGDEYKIGMVVSIMKDQLRSDLEKAGVVKALNSGF